jgi:pimeloyl-ACP methyl ester carboxylesterase
VSSKKKFGIAMLIIFLALVGWMLVGYTRWKQGAVARLQAGSRIVETASGPVEYATVGEGPAVLIIHGTPGGYDQGVLIAKVIGNPQFTFIAVSRPGYLRTPLSTGETPGEQADAYAALLDALNIRSAVILAVSGGGPSALQFALRHPDRCRGLILVSAMTQAPEPPVLTSDEQQALQGVMEKVLTSDFGNWVLSGLVRAVPSATIPQDPEVRLPDPEQTEIFLKLYDTLFPVSLRLAGIQNDTKQFSAMPAFPFWGISVPVLILHGTEDRNVPFATAELAAGAIPGAKLVRIQNGPHEFFLIRQRQAAFSAEVVAFLEGHLPAE